MQQDAGIYYGFMYDHKKRLTGVLSAEVHLMTDMFNNKYFKGSLQSNTMRDKLS